MEYCKKAILEQPTKSLQGVGRWKDLRENEGSQLQCEGVLSLFSS